MENWTKKWIRPNMVLNISHFSLELGHLRREKRRGEEEKIREEEEGRKEGEKKKLLRYGICVWKYLIETMCLECVRNCVYVGGFFLFVG